MPILMKKATRPGGTLRNQTNEGVTMPKAFRAVTHVLCLLVPAVFLALLSAPAAQARDQDLADRIQRQYESITSFRTDFVQVLTNAASGESEVRTGTIFYQQPRLIRWETEEPEQELLLVGKERVWQFFPEEEVAYRYQVDQIFQSKTMLRFISGEANLKQDFKLEEVGEEQGWTKIKLIPKRAEPGLVLAYLWIEPDTALLRQILLVDFFGNGNQLTLDDIERDISLDPSLFTFSPPAHVEVLENPAGPES